MLNLWCYRDLAEWHKLWFIWVGWLWVTRGCHNYKFKCDWWWQGWSGGGYRLSVYLFMCKSWCLQWIILRKMANKDFEKNNVVISTAKSLQTIPLMRLLILWANHITWNHESTIMAQCTLTFEWVLHLIVLNITIGVRPTQSGILIIQSIRPVTQSSMIVTQRNIQCDSNIKSLAITHCKFV